MIDHKATQEAAEAGCDTVICKPTSKWPYFDSPLYQVRQVMAAKSVYDLPYVLNVGCGDDRSFPKYLRKKTEITMVDTAKLPASKGNVEYVQADGNAYEYAHKTDKYGLVMLGIDVEAKDRLLDLVDRAEIVVIEGALDWAPYARIAKHCGMHRYLYARVSFEIVIPGLEADNYPLTATQAGDLVDVSKRELCVFMKK